MNFWRDVRFGFRLWRKNYGFAAAWALVLVVALALIAGGADVLLVETSVDILEVKAALDGIVTSQTRVAVVVEDDDRFRGMLTVDDLAGGITT